MRTKYLSFPSPTHEVLHCLKLALYWPVFGLLFYALERLVAPARYHVMYSPLDDYIPFCELFLIPYLFWFVFLLGIHLYTLFCNRPVFCKLMWSIILSYSLALLIFILYPNCQTLRPTVFPRDDLLTRFIADFYRFDTNTNVCPSLHVIGSLAVWSAARETKLFQYRGWRVFFHLATILICISTVFLKQHSILDLLAGAVVSAAVYVVVYRKEYIVSPLQIARRNKQPS